MRVLVTGGTGFVGSHLVESLLRDDHHVVVLDNSWTSSTSNLKHLSDPSLEIIQADVADSFPTSLKVDQIYHLACPASPKHFSTHPLQILDTCYAGTKNALEAARRLDARLLLTSTSEVYGDALECPQDESYYGNTNCFGPRSCYDEGKRVAESLVFAYRQQHGVDVRVARIFNTYGPRMAADDGRVVSSFIAAALKGSDLVVNGDGSSTRCFQYVDDCVDGLRRLMQSEWQGGPINLGAENEMTVGDLAKLTLDLVAERTGQRASKVVHGPALPDDPVRRRPDGSLAKEVLGWETHVTLEEGLRKTIDWHLEASSRVDEKLER